MNKLRPIVKTHGGKWYIHEWIIKHFPLNYDQLTYIEPMCAGASVFLNKSISQNEIINDIDCGIYSIFQTIQNNCDEFINHLKTIKYTKETFEKAIDEISISCFDIAVNEYILRRMSRGGLKKTFAWSKRLRGGLPGDENSWNTMIDLIPKISERIKNTTILNQNVFDIIPSYDNSDTLFYFDPPYLPSTRTAKKAYKFEMTTDDHVKLLSLIQNMKAKVVISGYESDLYNNYLNDWEIDRLQVANHSGQNNNKQKRIECIWRNY